MFRRSKKVLFWDFDGTLVYSKHLWSGSLLKAFNKYYPDKKVTYDDIEPHMCNCYTWDNPDNDYSKIIGELWWNFMGDHIYKTCIGFGLKNDDALLMKHYFRQTIKQPENYKIFDDAIDTLAKCKENGWRNYIVSNNYPDLREVTNNLGFSDYFDGYIISSEVGYDKPRKEIYEYALKLSDNPDICFMIGDNIRADIIGAENAGIKAILVHKNGEVKRQSDNLSNILNIINKD